MRASAIALGLSVACLFGAAPTEAKTKMAAVASGSTVRAQTDAPDKLETVVEVSVLHGTKEAKDADPRVGNIAELRDGPFARYASYRLLSRTELSLTRGRKRQLELPNGRLLEARLGERLADGSSRLIASINRRGNRDFLPLLEVKARPGQSFIVAGQAYQRGILVLVFKVLR